MQITAFDRIGTHIKNHIVPILFTSQAFLFSYFYYFISYREIFLPNAQPILAANVLLVAILFIWSLTCLDEEDVMHMEA